jgi:hypothetical protein
MNLKNTRTIKLPAGMPCDLKAGEHFLIKELEKWPNRKAAAYLAGLEGFIVKDVKNTLYGVEITIFTNDLQK